MRRWPGGHFLTKSLAYSTTLAIDTSWGRPGGGVCAASSKATGRWSLTRGAGRKDEALVDVQRTWICEGWGYLSHGEGWLASTAAARAREQKQIARDELEELKKREWVRDRGIESKVSMR